MRKPSVWIIAFLLILPSALAQEQGGIVWLSEYGERVTGYYPGQLNSIFSTVEQSGSSLHLKFGEREFGYATGLVTSSGANSVSIVNGGIEFPDGYAFSCTSSDCRILLRLNSNGLDYTNLTGRGSVVYRKPGEMSAGISAIISGLYEIKASTQSQDEIINITAKTEMAGGAFGDVNITSGGEITLQKWKENSDIFYAVFSTAPIGIYAPLFTNVRVVSSLSESDTGSGNLIKVSYGNAVAAKMQTANLLFSSGAAIYEKCKSTESGIYERFGSCLLAEPAQRRVSVMASSETGARGADGRMAYKKTDMTLIFPAETGYNNLKVEKFVPDTSKGNILVEREGIGGISLGFDNTEISVTGGSWFDLGISFEAELFYAFTSEYSLISCNAETRECFLGTNMERVIGGPTAINPLSTWTRPNVNPSIACGTDSDCPAGRFCDTDITKKCIIRAQCKKIDSVSGSGGIAIVFAGYGFSSESTLRAMAEQAASRLLQISPFKEYKERFTFWELMPPRSFSPSNSRLLKLQCPQSEIAVILTQYGYGASIAGGGGSILGDVSVDVSVSRGASMNYIDQMKIVHELGHSFGLEDEYLVLGYLDRGDPQLAHYAEAGRINPETGLPSSSPNCLRYDSAKRVWETLLGDGKGAALADEARKKQWTGCAAIEPFCDERHPDYQNACGNFLKPGMDSIMTGNTNIPAGKEFNEVSQAWLIRQFTR